jgi:molybdopterin-containing oxidoreductase family membrane subunit
MNVDDRQRQAVRPQKPSEQGEFPLVLPGVTFKGLTEQITTSVLRPYVPLFWFLVFVVALAATFMLVGAIGVLLDVGIGTFGSNIPNAWVFPIANYVWWIEIAVGGSLLSSILHVTNQSWRSSINRLAEAVTLSGIACAGLFPLIHMGRSWIFYWLLPYPNTMTIQPNFRSPLVWDVFGLSTYGIASVLFWYFDMIPDLAALRDQARTRAEHAWYGVLALGWTGSSRQWRLQERASLLLAGILTPLVFTIHTVVSFDFCITLLPGWHSTIFPPYFVDGAILSGISMVTMLSISLRAHFGLHKIVTERHLNNLSKLILTTSVILCYVYVMEPFTAWYSGDPYEMYTVHARAVGPFAWTYWAFILLGLGVPQFLWWKKNRTTPKRLFIIAFLIVVGMWEERYMLMVTSLSRDFLPSSWANFAASAEDNALLYGSIGLFLLIAMFLVRMLPMVSLYNVKKLLPFSKPGGGVIE